MEFQYVLSGILISLGAFFLLIGSVGLIRLPDFFARTHATGKADTLGIMLVISGLLIYELTKGMVINSAKLLIIIAFVGLTNPTATNALAKAAFNFRMMPWFKKDKEKEKKEKKEKE